MLDILLFAGNRLIIYSFQSFLRKIMSDTDVQIPSPNTILGAQQGMDKQSPYLHEVDRVGNGHRKSIILDVVDFLVTKEDGCFVEGSHRRSY